MTSGVEQLAADFWECVGATEPFPRNLEHAILTTKPVSIIKLSRLCPPAVGDWLRQRRGVAFPLTTDDRRLNGCLISHRGHGFLFVEGSLLADELRMIVAHEFAHYLAEYDRPRTRAARRLGNTVLSVLDGERAATAAEQWAATLVGVEMGVHVHYMDRTAGGRYTHATNLVERTANDLALELVAPWRTVLAAVQVQGRWPTESAHWHQVLEKSFGLPTSWAVPYATRLRRRVRRRQTFSDLLGF